MARLTFEQEQPLKARAFMQRYETQGARIPEALELAARIEAQLGDADASARYLEQLRTEFPDYTPSKAFQGEPETP
jgi:type IV pilus assembly protein PilF